jgi:hypothetical protein
VQLIPDIALSGDERPHYCVQVLRIWIEKSLFCIVFFLNSVQTKHRPRSSFKYYYIDISPFFIEYSIYMYMALFNMTLKWCVQYSSPACC